jgi:hypothetical protein
MPVLDTEAYGGQLTAQMDDRFGAKVVTHTEDLVLHQGTNGFRFG